MLVGRIAMAGDGMTHKDDELAAWLAACARGEREGLRRIFDAEASRLMTIAHRIVRRRDLAEEVVQDAFLQIWRKAGQYSPARGSARGWIVTIVRNRSLNLLRDARREELADVEVLDAMRDTEHRSLAADVYADLDAASRLRDCLAQLDEAKRSSIIMAYLSGYTHGEIAGRLSVPLGTAKAWIRRGLSALRECMA